MKIVEVTLETNKKFKGGDTGKLRGYMGNYFRDIIEFHNHKDEVTFNYAATVIQYRVINGKFSILGINQGGELLQENYHKIKKIIIGEEEISVEPKIEVREEELTIADEAIYKYKFDSIWFALNSENYKKYREGTISLDRQLVNNIIEFFKLAGIWADKKIIAFGDFSTQKFNQKDIVINGFVGEFTTNVKLPNNISIGKRKSLGLGRIKEL